MTPFNPKATCPKCGGGGVASAWRAAGIEDGMTVLGMPIRDKSQPERIVRRCTTCGYSWPEAPLDREEGT